MNWQQTNLRTRLHVMAAAILLIGLGCAVWFHLTAEEAPTDLSVYEEQHSKMYVRNLQVYGGSMAVMEDDLHRWFQGLWQGKSLGYTVACLAVLVSGGFFLVARHIHSNSTPGSRDNGPK
jgi:hypothetical protein